MRAKLQKKTITHATKQQYFFLAQSINTYQQIAPSPIRICNQIRKFGKLHQYFFYIVIITFLYRRNI